MTLASGRRPRTLCRPDQHCRSRGHGLQVCHCGHRRLGRARQMLAPSRYFRAVTNSGFRRYRPRAGLGTALSQVPVYGRLREASLACSIRLPQAAQPDCSSVALVSLATPGRSNPSKDSVVTDLPSQLNISVQIQTHQYHDSAWPRLQARLSLGQRPDLAGTCLAYIPVSHTMKTEQK